MANKEYLQEWNDQEWKAGIAIEYYENLEEVNLEQKK